MIKAASDSQQPTAQTPPSFPTYNPAQQSKSMMKNAPLPPNPTSTQPAIPAKPKFPDPTTKTYIKADGTKTDKSGDSNDKNNKNSNEKPKKKSNWRMALGVIVLLFVVLGTGTGFYLTQQSQDLRQQADEIDWTCPAVQSCPGTGGLLVDCTPPEADGTSRNSTCDSSQIGRIEPCGGAEYCCNGTVWSNDMTSCDTDETVTPPISSYHDYADSSCRTYGWVIDSNASPNSSFIHVYADGVYGTGTFIGEYLADTVRTDLNDANANITGDHGFDITFNSQNTESSILFDGNPHELYVYGIDSQDPVNSNVLIENTPQTITCPILTDAVSCDIFTGTLTDGTVADENTEMTYKITSSGGNSTTSIDLTIHGDFEGPGWDKGWVIVESDLTPTDSNFESTTTYKEMTDLLVNEGYDRQQILDEGIILHATVAGPEGVCWDNGQWNGTGEACQVNHDCFNKTIKLESATDVVSCANITGTLTNGTVVGKDTDLTYEVTSSGGNLITGVELIVYGIFDDETQSRWGSVSYDTTPTDGLFSGSTTYAELTDKLFSGESTYEDNSVNISDDKQQSIDEGIQYTVATTGPDGSCSEWGEMSKTGEECVPCIGTIKLETTSDYNDDNSDDDSSSDDYTTTVGCNDICVTNSDCQDTDHICATTADGSNRCRLTAYTSSESCVIESSGDTTTDTTTQPSLPAELPESGPEDWLNWLKAGLVTMGIGTALFLLL